MDYGQTQAFYAGDSTTQVLTRLKNAGYPLRNVDLYKMAHHGVNQTTDEEFIRRLSPKFAVQPSGLGSAIHNNYVISEDAAVLKQSGTKIYQCHAQPDYIIMRSDGSALECVQGRVFGTSDQSIDFTYYVDANASTAVIQDGTQDRPFTTVMQAISAIPYKVSANVTINVADGYYGNEHESESAKNRITFNTGRDVRITINGNSEDRTAVVLNGIYAVSSFLTLNNLTVDLDNQTGIMALGSTIQLGNVAIKSYADEMAENPHSAILLRENSKLITQLNKPIRIEQCNECIIAQSGSSFIANSTVEIGSHASSIANPQQGSYIITGDFFAFDNSADKLSFGRYKRENSTPVQIMATHEAFADSVSLLRNANTVDWIEIFYRSKDNIFGSTGKIYAPNGKAVGVFVPNKGGDGSLYDKQATFGINGTTISIANVSSVHIINGQSPQLTTVDGLFNIEKVIAGYTDYIDLDS